jgi:hypothetical protein
MDRHKLLEGLEENVVVVHVALSLWTEYYISFI